MSKYMLSAVLAFALVLSSCSNTNQPTGPDQQRPVSSNKATSQWFDLQGAWIWNPCCNEYIFLSGKYHVVFKEDGSQKLNTANVSAVDAAGNTYHGMLNYSYTTNEDGTYQYREHYNFTSPTGCSFSYKIAYHYEIDENGNWQFILDQQEITCN
jgi:hypothetical protein